METSLISLFCILVVLAGTATAGVSYHDVPGVTKCDPDDKKTNCKQNEHCQDEDADGHWTCVCLEGYYVANDDGHCVLDACPFGSGEVDNHGRHTSAAVGEYRTIKGRCYYYELTALKFTTAVANCKTKFDGTGRLFEPREKQISDTVVSQARAINNDEAYWLGIRTQVHTDDRKFYYLTEGPAKSTIKNWSPGEPNDVSGEEDCVSVLRFDGAGLGWADTECDMSAFSICEVNEDEACKSPEYATDNFCDDENNHAGCNWDGGACCNNPFDKWDMFCKKCECKDPYARDPSSSCEDTETEKKCKKCKDKTCKNSGHYCSAGCKKTCDLC